MSDPPGLKQKINDENLVPSLTDVRISDFYFLLFLSFIFNFHFSLVNHLSAGEVTFISFQNSFAFSTINH